MHKRTQLLHTWVGGSTTPPDTVTGLREALGRSHYERMRLAMLPGLVIASWEDLPAPSREAYRRHTDYLVPALTEFINQLTTQPQEETG